MTRRQGLAAAAVLAAVVAILAGVLGGRHGTGCHARTPTGRGASWLAQALADVPCPASGAAVYGAQDDHRAPLDVLDPIAEPGGGYLGVYHTPTGSHHFEILLAQSGDLVHWHRLRVLEPGASMPTLRPVPGGHGYLLADERSGRHATVELHWFASLSALLHGTPARSIDLPLRFSRSNNGTPALVAIQWNGGLGRSRIALTFHYESAAGPDREAFGVLSGFRHWSPRRDTHTDGLLEREGFPGNHGDQRWFDFAGRTWRILEAQSRPGSFASWHVLLYEPSAGGFAPVSFETEAGRFATSFGNPTAQVLPAPDHHGRVLAVTTFVFRGAPLGGELVFFRRVP